MATIAFAKANICSFFPPASLGKLPVVVGSEMGVKV